MNSTHLEENGIGRFGLTSVADDLAGVHRAIVGQKFCLTIRNFAGVESAFVIVKQNLLKLSLLVQLFAVIVLGHVHQLVDDAIVVGLWKGEEFRENDQMTSLLTSRSARFTLG